MQTNHITIRQLRATLFAVDNQEMTIAELRALLFAGENQDEQHPIWALGAVINRLDKATKKAGKE